MTTIMPKWSTPDRQAHLVKLFLDSGGFCIYGHPNCLNPNHHYEVYIEALIGDWKAEDREVARLEWLNERRAMHSLGERRTPVSGRFNNISMDIFHDKQPLFYVEGLGMSGLTLQPFARVKLSSSYLRLYVDISQAIKGISKNRRRKAIRYAKAFPREVEARMLQLVSLAVRDYLSH
jgi:hypothetical protein